MAFTTFDQTVRVLQLEKLRALEEELDSDIVFYYGESNHSLEKFFRDCSEELQNNEMHNDTLSIILNTPGGSAETVEKQVEIV